MILGESLRNAMGFVKRAIGYRSLGTASLIQRNLPYIVAPLRPDGGRIAVDALSLTLDPRRHAYVLPLLPAVQDLVKVAGGAFVPTEDGGLEYRIGGLRLRPENKDDLSVLWETFGKRLYEIQDGREWFALDIGMNVGYVSLYFADALGWDTLAFEPFSTTYEIAVRNVERNGLGARIQTRKAGVAGKAGRTEIAFNEESRSTNGLFGNLQADRASADGRVEIELVDAADAFEEALALAGERPLLAKLDCEGAEYDIIDRLVERNLLERVEGFIIEYHFILPEHTEERIRTPLLAAGFLLKTLWTGIEAGGLLALRKGSAR